MRRRYQQACINFLYIIALIGISTFCLIFYIQMKEVNKANEWVIHSHRVIEKLYSMMSDINLADSKMRGYFITRDEEFYKEYKSTKNRIFENLESMESFTADNLPLQKKLVDLTNIINQRYILVDRVLAVRKNNSMDYTMKYAEKIRNQYPSGKLLSQKISELSNEIVNDESSVLEKRNSTAIHYFGKTTMLAVYGSVCSAVLMLICFLILNRQLLYRFRAESNLLKSEKELKQLAYFDTLTGLANRTILLNKIEEFVQSARDNGSMVALIFIDIDNFKNINDSFGHAVGDNLLRAFANVLQQLSDDKKMIFRLSGDEFAIVVKDVHDKMDITPLLESILETTKKPINIDSHQLFITASMGISLFPDDGDDAKILLKSADIAMYRAKKTGKNNYQFCMSELILEVEERAIMEQQLYRAVQQNEFVIVYQPKISLKTGAVTGFEALIRWNTPNEDLIFPSQFIELAESNGLIIPIGEWMLQAVCEQGSLWQLEGVPVKGIAVNISIRELCMPDFIARVKRILQDTGFDPHLLELEITESILMHNSEKNLYILRELKSMGIKITIDDFGTGYSSLSYLHLFSIDKLKIDQFFIKKITSENHNPIIINAIINMAHSLGIQVIGEGVETETQLEFLKKYDCDEAQGFHCSYPLTPSNVHEFLLKQDLRFLHSK